MARVHDRRPYGPRRHSAAFHPPVARGRPCPPRAAARVRPRAPTVANEESLREPPGGVEVPSRSFQARPRSRSRASRGPSTLSANAARYSGRSRIWQKFATSFDCTFKHWCAFHCRPSLINQQTNKRRSRQVPQHARLFARDLLVTLRADLATSAAQRTLGRASAFSDRESNRLVPRSLRGHSALHAARRITPLQLRRRLPRAGSSRRDDAAKMSNNSFHASAGARLESSTPRMDNPFTSEEEEVRQDGASWSVDDVPPGPKRGTRVASSFDAPALVFARKDTPRRHLEESTALRH